MDIQQFINKFAEQFEETKVTDFTASTRFRDLEEWSSLTALLIISMVDEEYQIRLKANEIRNSETINDLFNIIKSRKE